MEDRTKHWTEIIGAGVTEVYEVYVFESAEVLVNVMLNLCCNISEITSTIRNTEYMY